MTAPRARIHCPAPLSAGVELELDAKASTHLAAALRVAVGETVVLFSGDGREHEAEIVTVGRRVGVRVLAGRTVSRESPAAITLFQGIARGDRMDLILQKATELGVARVVPVLAERSQGGRRPEQQARRRRHWEGVLASACEQCGRNRLPELWPAVPVSALAEASAGLACRLLLDPRAGSGLGALAVAAPAGLLVGPEGGLSEAERAAAAELGFTAVHLGPRVLRTETAALSALAALQLLCGDLGGG